MKISTAHKFGAAVLVALSMAFTGCLTDDKADEGPAISTNPSDVTVASGQMATFTVVASGSGTLTYQWMKNDDNIAGATLASYAVVASSGDDGAEFTCKVTDSKGFTTSSAGTLNILVTEQLVTLGAQDNATTASSLDLDNWTSYTASTAAAHSSEIDIVFAYSTSGTTDSAAIYSPIVAKNGVGGSGGFTFMSSWTSANSTDMRVVSVANWATVTTAASIKALYDAGTTPNPAGRVFVRAGTTIVARSNGDLYVLLLVTAVTQSATGTANLTGKAKR